MGSSPSLHDLHWVSLPIVKLGLVIVVMVAVILSLRLFRQMVIRSLSRRLGRSWSSLHSGTLIISYMLGFMVFWALIQASGVNTRAFTVVFGALSVGIGFGLQGIVNNFISGIVILLERPIKVDDRILVDGMEGTIVDIGIRATTVLTNEGVSIILPNSSLITSPVVNRSLADRKTRFKVPVGVAYGSDPRQVEQVLLAVAAAHPGVLKEPAPCVVFEEFGDSALKFFLWAWTEEYAHFPTMFKSELNYAIHEALAKAGIEIPFPQMDVRMKDEKSV